MNIENIRTLRRRTQASYAECKKALIEADQNIEEAERILMSKGLRLVDSAPTEDMEMGVVNSYIHTGGRVGVLVETHCRTDFVAKTEEFQHFVKEVALQVASMKPQYISRDDISDDELIAEYERRLARLENVGEKGNLEDLVEAEMVQWYAESCLLEQAYVKQGSKIVKELLAELINKVGEPCRIKRFVRWEIGANNGEIRVSQPQQKVEDLEDTWPDVIKERFKTPALIMLFGICLFILSVFSF